MSLVLDGTTTALHATSGISGVSYPYTIAFWGKPTNNTLDRTMSALCVAGSDLNFTWCDQNAAALRMLNRFAGVDATASIAAAISNAAWQSFIFVAKDNNEKWVYDNGVISTVATTDNGAVPAFNRLSIGCGLRSAGPERFFPGRIGYWSFHNVAADQSFATAHALGTHPSLLSGCQQLFELVSGKSNSVGSWSFSDVGSPTYDASDNPPVFNGVYGIATPIADSLGLDIAHKINQRRF